MNNDDHCRRCNPDSCGHRYDSYGINLTLDPSTLWGTVVEETKEDMLVRILTCLTDIEEDILTEGFDDLNDWIGDIQDKIEEVKALLESEEDDNETN